MFPVMDSIDRCSEKCLDSQLWYACAGAKVQIPPINSKIVYFPQGHAEHSYGKVDFGQTRIPSLMPCRVSAIKFLADPDTDEVYVKMTLIPLRENELDSDSCFLENNGIESTEKSASFAKVLTQSDATNGGGFSVPRYCAETIFPKLDYSAEPPVQTLIAKDVHGQTWKFRHIYRGTPRRHLLTTGWSNFVNHKRLSAGDSVVFLRAENGDLCVGIKRAKKGIGGGTEHSSGSNCAGIGGRSGFVYENANSLTRRKCDGELKGRVNAESVVEAVICAVHGRPFEVVYYPQAGKPEFCVKASAVKAAMQIQWCAGMRFKMPLETEDSSMISWFMGTVSSIQVADPVRWPDSPWHLLQVEWDEQDFLQNYDCVNPWLVELVTNAPTYHLSSFSPPQKKSRFLHQTDFSLSNQVSIPSFSSNLPNQTSSSLNIQDNSSAPIQGARHAQFRLPSSDFPFDKHQQPELLPGGIPWPGHEVQPEIQPCGSYMSSTENNADISCLLTVGDPDQHLKQPNEAKAPYSLLFGQLIHTEHQTSSSSSKNSSSEGNSQNTSNFCDGSGSASNQSCPTENSSDGGSSCYKYQDKSGNETENINLLRLAL